MPILRFIKEAAFEPPQIAALVDAFDSVCGDLGMTDRADPQREKVARAIIACAQSGELDPVRLRLAGLTAMKGFPEARGDAAKP